MENTTQSRSLLDIAVELKEAEAAIQVAMTAAEVRALTARIRELEAEEKRWERAALSSPQRLI